MYLVFALGSALFASITTILCKVGLKDVGSNMGTFIRTGVVLLMSYVIVLITHESFSGISKRSYLFLIISGLTTGLSWLCYYKALKLGAVNKVVPIDKMSIVLTLVLAFVFLHEDFTWKSILGCLLITGGTLLMVL